MTRAVLFAIAILIASPAGLGASPGQVHPVPAEGLALRSAPDESAPILRQLEAGQRLLEYERRGPWMRVGVFGGVSQEGWVPDAFLAALPEDPAPEEEIAPVVEEAEELLAEPRYLLDITGSPAVEFIGHCITVDAFGTRKKGEFKGFIPRKFTISGQAVRCTVQKWDARGRLQVGLYSGNTRIAYQETAAQFNWVQVFTAGPWGRAGNVRGNNPTVFLPRGERRQGGVVPPFKPPIIPRFPVGRPN
ncbi:MAG: SH3 domain-containing protein [Pseudomonadota bacterium]